MALCPFTGRGALLLCLYPIWSLVNSEPLGKSGVGLAEDARPNVLEARRQLRQSQSSSAESISIVEGQYDGEYHSSDDFQVAFAVGSGLSSGIRCLLMRYQEVAVFDFQPCLSPLILTNQLSSDGIYTLGIYGSVAATGEIVNATSTWVLDRVPPNTRITSSTAFGSTVSVSFEGSDAEQLSGYQCNLDRGVWASCLSPWTSASVSIGPHSFEVRAVDAAGNVDPSPASYTWRRTHPSSPSPSPSPHSHSPSPHSHSPSPHSHSSSPHSHPHNSNSDDSDDSGFDSNRVVIAVAAATSLVILCVCFIIIFIAHRLSLGRRLRAIAQLNKS